MLPQYERLGGTKPIFTISFGRFSVIVVSLPFFGFIFCVLYSVLFYFKQSTGTHCHVFNLLPSISAAIGNYQPQRLVWQLCIVLHFLPRLLIARMYLKHYDDIIRRNRRGVSYLAVLLNVLENFALLGLSLFTSIDSYGKILRAKYLAKSRRCSFEPNSPQKCVKMSFRPKFTSQSIENVSLCLQKSTKTVSAHLSLPRNFIC